MKKYVLISASLFLVFSNQVYAQKAKQKTARKQSAKPVAAKASAKPVAPISSANAAQLNQALRYVQSGQCQQAAPMLYTMSKRSDFEKERMQIKYILGNCLIDLGLNQVAAFELVEVIKHGNSRYVKQAIEKLSLAADALGDDSLLNYAVSKVNVSDVPANGKDLIYFRLGEVKSKTGQFEKAIDAFNRVPDTSKYYFLSRYNKGLALLEMKRPQEAIQLFTALSNIRSSAGVTDTNRVLAKMGLARAYYQAHDWDNSIATYRDIPKDHVLWHDALFESSWAMLRGARFRSALSSFHSLHSSYYLDHYIPESLLVRSIVYLYICRYDEMEKVLDLFDKSYGKMSSDITVYLNRYKDPDTYYQEVESILNFKTGKTFNKTRLPLVVSNFILHEGDVKRGFNYLRALNDEKNKLDQIPAISKSSLGARGRKIIGNRFKNARISIGEMVRHHMIAMNSELKDLYEQASFIRYEMINGKKEQLKKRIAGKEIMNTNVNDDIDRSVYVQNGYEYWPFDGEYWLDEIGNYHFLGKQNCEKR